MAITIWRKILVVAGRIIGGFLFFGAIVVVVAALFVPLPSNLPLVGQISEQQELLIDLHRVNKSIPIGLIGLLFLMLSEILSSVSDDPFQ